MTTLYVKPACVQCDMTKRYLDKNGVEYSTVDVTKDENALEMILDMGFSSAPVVITDDKSWAGFNLEMLETLVK